jgi:hypothetical protein
MFLNFVAIQTFQLGQKEDPSLANGEGMMGRGDKSSWKTL